MSKTIQTKFLSALSLKGKELFQLQEQLEDIQKKYRKELALRKQTHNLLIEARGNIRVHCRIRPFLENEDSSYCPLTIIDEENLTLTSPNQKQRPRKFTFDNVYPVTAKQSLIFKDVQPLLVSLLDGYHICIVVYGQTGSGKTYTMVFQNHGILIPF